ncbi:hypothetical protein [Microvirga sp. Mcv34]|uniref:hypothetical protein n=1 Tax=Microvirga sp. Mcv34 TaxID=2926016 RepID=UPI0021C6AF1B|nr:hypothetical protein [Microvirga sp. Mcv34]
MARRVIFGANSAGRVGIYVSKPGIDAYTAPEAQLLFSDQRRHFMILQSGSIQLTGSLTNPGSGVRVNFTQRPGQKPFVLCGDFNPRPSMTPVRAVVDTTGFTAYPAADWQGQYPAAGKFVQYFAFLKSE